MTKTKLVISKINFVNNNDEWSPDSSGRIVVSNIVAQKHCNDLTLFIN